MTIMSLILIIVLLILILTLVEDVMTFVRERRNKHV